MTIAGKFQPFEWVDVYLLFQKLVCGFSNDHDVSFREGRSISSPVNINQVSTGRCFILILTDERNHGLGNLAKSISLTVYLECPIQQKCRMRSWKTKTLVCLFWSRFCWFFWHSEWQVDVAGISRVKPATLSAEHEPPRTSRQIFLFTNLPSLKTTWMFRWVC